MIVLKQLFYGMIVSEMADSSTSLNSHFNKLEVSVPEFKKHKDATPVLIDDIISTTRTMIETVGHLKKAGMNAPVCIGIHAVFSGNAYQDLLDSGVERFVTCNTIPHPFNAIDLSDSIARDVKELMQLN